MNRWFFLARAFRQPQGKHRLTEPHIFRRAVSANSLYLLYPDAALFKKYTYELVGAHYPI